MEYKPNIINSEKAKEITIKRIGLLKNDLKRYINLAIEKFKKMNHITYDDEKIEILDKKLLYILLSDDENLKKILNFDLDMNCTLEDEKGIIDSINLFYFMNLSILKRVCSVLNITYAQLAEQIGYSEGNINKVASTGNISEPLKKAIELYLRNLELEKQLEDYEAFKTLVRKAIN